MMRTTPWYSAAPEADTSSGTRCPGLAERGAGTGEAEGSGGLGRFTSSGTGCGVRGGGVHRVGHLRVGHPARGALLLRLQRAALRLGAPRLLRERSLRRGAERRPREQCARHDPPVTDDQGHGGSRGAGLGARLRSGSRPPRRLLRPLTYGRPPRQTQPEYTGKGHRHKTRPAGPGHPVTCKDPRPRRRWTRSSAATGTSLRVRTAMDVSPVLARNLRDRGPALIP